MIQLRFIKDVFERECTEYLGKYINRFTNLYLKPMNDLNYYRKNCSDLIIVQPPFINSSGETRYNDWSIISRSNGIDNRYEISSLKQESSLNGKALKHALESRNIPESQLVLILLGNGYNDIVNDMLMPLIRKESLPVLVIRTVQEYKNHIDEIFCKNKHKIVTKKSKVSYNTI